VCVCVCVVRYNRSATGQIFCIRQFLEKQWECNGTVPQLLKDLAYDSVRREVLYNILIEFDIAINRVRLIKMSK
jgi:hypothetical protein